jgi:hypothetical protein
MAVPLADYRTRFGDVEAAAERCAGIVDTPSPPPAAQWDKARHFEESPP